MSIFSEYKPHFFETLFWAAKNGPVAIVATKDYEKLCEEFQHYLNEKSPHTWKHAKVGPGDHDSIVIQYPSGGCRYVFSSDDIHMQYVNKYVFQFKIDTAKLKLMQ